MERISRGIAAAYAKIMLSTLLRLTCLAENTSLGACRPVHGLSFYLETPKHRVLFDMGPDETAFENASLLGIDFTQVDIAVLSHGHNDHGGGLGRFLQMNHSAPVYVHKRAFEPHQSLSSGKMKEIGLDPALRDHPQVKLLDGDTVLDEELRLFCPTGSRLLSPANDTLLENGEKDRFSHELCLVLSSAVYGRDLLLLGCGHRGVVNCLSGAGASPALCVGGFHLCRPATGECVPEEILSGIVAEIKKQEQTVFYTCHCTGEKAFSYLSGHLPGQVRALTCGDSLYPEQALPERLCLGPVTLRKARTEDTEQIWQRVWSDAGAAELMLWKVTESREEAEDRMERTLRYQRRWPAYFIAITETDEPIGFAGLREQSPGVAGESGICVAREFRGRGYGLLAARGLMRLAFDCMGAEAFYYSCFHENLPSAALARKLGCVYESSETITRETDGRTFLCDHYCIGREAFLKQQHDADKT